MEKLLLDLQQTPESEKEIKTSNTSLNDFSQSSNKTCHSSSSFPDLQLLMQEFETKVNSKNNLSTETDSKASQKKEALHVQVDAVNNTSNLLKFVIQVPNSIFSLLNKENSNDQRLNFSFQSSKNKLLKSQRKTRFGSLLKKLFKRKKNDSFPPITIDTNVSQNIELLKLLTEKYEESTNSFHSLSRNDSNYKSIIKNEHLIAKNSNSDNSSHIVDKLTDSKEKQTVIIPITYNFDEKSHMALKPNLTIQFETIPQTELNECSNHIKIINQTPVQCPENPQNTLEKDVEESKAEISHKQDVSSTEILLENLIKILSKTTEKLDSLDRLKTVVENLSEKELKLKNPEYCNQNDKVNANAKSLKYFLHFVNDVKNKPNESKPVDKEKQQVESVKVKLHIND